MAESGFLYVRNLAVKRERRFQGRVSALIENGAGASFPASVMLLYFYDGQGRIRDRITVRLPKFKPSEKRNVSALFRLKNDELFLYEATLQPGENKQ